MSIDTSWNAGCRSARPSAVGAKGSSAAGPSAPGAGGSSTVGMAESWEAGIAESAAGGSGPGPLPRATRVTLIGALVRVLIDLTTPARALVSAVNALLALERQQLRRARAARSERASRADPAEAETGEPSGADLLPESVRGAITEALTRVLGDPANPAQVVIAAGNALLALDRNSLAAEQLRRRSRDPARTQPMSAERRAAPIPRSAGPASAPEHTAPAPAAGHRPPATSGDRDGGGRRPPQERSASVDAAWSRAAGMDRAQGADEHHERERAATRERHQRRVERAAVR